MSSPQFRQGRGYLVALIGGFAGAMAFLAACVAVAKGDAIQLQSQANFSRETTFVISVILGTTCAEVLGCWFALRWRRYQKSRTTAVWLTALFIPGWIVYFILSLILGGFLSALLLFAGLPLLARAFTNNPNIPGGISKAVHINAQRPPMY